MACPWPDPADPHALELLGFVRCVMPHLLARGEPASYEVLRDQYVAARVRSARVAGSRLTVEFEVPENAPRTPWADFTTEALRVTIHPFTADGECTLSVCDGAIDVLEADTKGPPWPERPLVVAVHERTVDAETRHRGNNALAGLVSNLEYASGLTAAEPDDAPLLAGDEPNDRRGLRLALRYSLASAKDLLALLRAR